jgi:hypothetical protein
VEQQQRGHESSPFLVLIGDFKRGTLRISNMKLFAAALEYAPGRRLDGQVCTYVRFRVIVDGADELWAEDDGSAAEHLEANEIFVRHIEEVDGVHVARIDAAATDLSGFTEWAPGCASEFSTGTGILTLRTFLNVLGPDGASLFDADDCWQTIRIGGRPLAYWYECLASECSTGKASECSTGIQRLKYQRIDKLKDECKNS